MSHRTRTKQNDVDQTSLHRNVWPTRTRSKHFPFNPLRSLSTIRCSNVSSDFAFALEGGTTLVVVAAGAGLGAVVVDFVAEEAGLESTISGAEGSGMVHKNFCPFGPVIGTERTPGA